MQVSILIFLDSPATLQSPVCSLGWLVVSILVFLDSPATLRIIPRCEMEMMFQSLFSWTLLQRIYTSENIKPAVGFQSLFSWTLLQL